MTLKEVMGIIHYKSYKIPADMRRAVFHSLCHDSRKAMPGVLYFCRVGALIDGHIYAKYAYQNGARYFVVEHEVDLPADAAQIIVEDATAEMTRLAIAFYQDPGKEMTLIGITGTKGKTTVALSVYNIACSYGIMMGYIGTNGIYYGGKRLETVNTTPDALELQKSLREMRDFGVTHVVVEVSSQALKQYRTAGLQFRICAFTNLYEDHIGGVEHADMNEYKACKRRLFTDHSPETVIVNSDDPEADYMIEGVTYKKLIRVSAMGDGAADLYASNGIKIKSGIRPGISFDCHFKNVLGGCDSIFIPLPGLYSIQNGLLTMAICRELGIPKDFIIEELSKLRIPGRFETVELESRKGTLFIIDYAHNGTSLTAVLNALREYEPKRIICLFGSVGGRTFGRRAELGLAAREGADVIIITSDNPDNENPYRVMNDIQKAFEGSDKPVFQIEDREEAVKKAYEIAEDGDFVLLAGKGHETYQLVMGRRIPFSERRILEMADRYAMIMG